MYQFSFQPYQRTFKQPLQTSHGTWKIREGIILSLTDNFGKTSWGEIAPISWFGSETFTQALNYCRQLPTEITTETIYSIPDLLPACQFGFESAIGANKNQNYNSLTYSGLLPAGKAALQQWGKLWAQDYRTFKWKIGVYPIAEELEIFAEFTHSLPALAKLRLDANGGLTYDEAKLWLYLCDRTKIIEFIEQPLGVEQLEQILELSKLYKTAIALDESVATFNQLQACYQEGWRGIFVIKPSIIGFPSRLREFCQKYNIDAVFSSAFETEIGRKAALNLAVELANPNRAVGFGIDNFLSPDTARI
ncbi:MAG: o-succinylbenzoate synthase [Chroococcus sp. CMT-3BRIN-NPC107]|jgi:O-succinylbenzoate synthase|nr:o-succinylbenzoate synthase [Chroococcus sp. CMT-3BRIN-NPC107]